ncbi:MAG: AN1-type zinc finger domain-containing protein [Candidatus Thorarchaeota archaeon]|nr:AN1-type zinc finger domain-containing protein [Candidatus Thorarchaeota archaeon]
MVTKNRIDVITMARCSLCGQEDLVFTCPYCNSVYCTDHRLPEGHGCPGIHLVQDRAKRRVSDSLDGSYLESEDEGKRQQRQQTSRRRPKRRKRRFSAQERKDLAISALLVTLVSISLQAGGILRAFTVVPQMILSGFWWVIAIIAGSLLLAYFVHEFAHKFVAQHYNMWAEFRMTTSGYYLSLVAILFGIPIFGTGVVYTSGADSLEKDGKVNAAGPLSNFCLAALFTVLSIFLPLAGFGLSFYVYFILQIGVSLNAMLGLFNMIPIQPFDGGTIFKWNRAIWVLMAISLLLLLLFGYFVMPSIYMMFPA